jgi:uncharacterized protein
MIHSFTLENFYSFAKLSKVDFEVNDKAPRNNAYIQTPSGTRLSKVEAIVGPNASGKTNLLKVLPFIKWIIVDSFNQDPAAPVLVNPYMFGNFQTKPSTLSVEFEMNGRTYLYKLLVNKERILEEELKEKTKTNKRITYKLLFVRSWDISSKKYILNGKNFGFPKNFENTLRTNASAIAVGVRFNHKLSTEINDYWQKIETNVAEAGWVGDRSLPNAQIQLLDAINFFDTHGELKAKAEKLLSRFDLGLEELLIKKQGPMINVEGVHMYKGERVNLPFSYESSGTKELIVILKNILNALNNGGIAIVDEIDTSLHPEMVLALFELFIHPETNPKQSQIIFNTHSLLLLNKLDKYQIIFTEKNADGYSETWRLDDMSNVRPNENFYSKYMAGVYGAIPRIK